MTIIKLRIAGQKAGRRIDMSIFLAPEDVRKLTGRARKALQIAYLKDNGIAFRVNASGWPVVTLSEIEGGKAKQKEPQKWQSDMIRAA